MTIRNPCHPGETIAEELAELKISVADAAKALGVTRHNLDEVVNCRAPVSAEMALRLEQALGSTADTWLRLQANYDLAQIRKRAGEIKTTRLAPAIA